ncbi:MAG: ABC transporter substrate-binding protein [Bacillota bacterium]|jgi:oligopeptide transport system substrate-binding protein|nr:ABC transporter substrate-binding protein [Clostridia bacterium]
MKIFRSSLLIIMFLLLFGLSGCSKSDFDSNVTFHAPQTQDKRVIIEHLKTPVTTIDPAYVQNESEIMIAKLIFQGLVQENSEGEVVPCLAKEWTVSPDGLTYVFYLHKGVYFHNGKEIKAGDFKFSWERVLRINAPYAYLFANIQGADEVLAGKETLASGITALNDYTLKVTLKRPQKNFINLLTHPAGAVLDRYELVEQGVNFAKPGNMSQPAYIPSGSGPFLLIEWIDGRNLTLGRNPLYFHEKPSIWRVEFTLAEKVEDALLDFLAGKVLVLQDVTSHDLDRSIIEPDQISLLEKPLQKFRYVGINAKIKPFDNKFVRDAVMYGLNDKEILYASRGESGEVLTGYVTDYWYRQSVQEKIYYTYNKEAAVNMLVQAGYPGGEKLPEIPFYCGDTDEDRIVGEKIVENLAAIGLQVKVYPLPQKDLRRVVKNGEAAFYTGVFTAKSSELEDFFREQVDSKWQKTISNPDWDVLLDKAGQQDQTMRLNLYRQLEKEILGDSRIRYLYSYKSAAVVSDRLDSFQLGPGNNVYFEGVRFKEDIPD